METVYLIFVVLHLLSWALVLGGWFATIRNPQVTPGMMHGSFGALLFGIILMGLAMSDAVTRNPDHMKLGIKGVIAIAVVILLAVAKRQLAAVSAIGVADENAVEASPAAQGEAALIATTSSGARMLINLAGALVIVNVAIAVLWR